MPAHPARAEAPAGPARHGIRERSQEAAGLPVAAQDHHVAWALVDQVEDARPRSAAERPDPAKELGVDPVVHADVRAQAAAAEAKPALEHAPRASPRGKVEEDDRVGGREPRRQDTELHPVDDPPLAADQLIVDAAPILRCRFDPAGAGVARASRTRRRGGEAGQDGGPSRLRGWSCPSPHSRSRRRAAPDGSLPPAPRRPMPPRRRARRRP